MKQLSQHLPPELNQGTIRRYVEPFIGGGAMFLNIVRSYNIEECIISDVHEDLILCYQTIQRDVEAVIQVLEELRVRYLYATDDERKTMYYEVRSLFNAQRPNIDFLEFQPAWIERTAHIIFLNHTCFNGLFRFNSKGEFNVPHGRYKKPRIFDHKHLYAWAELLQRVQILQGDFSICQDYGNSNTFYYFDPPYRPLNKTAAFTSYARRAFTDFDQKRLAQVFRHLHKMGARLMLSNSDPRNKTIDDYFFEDLYAGFHMSTVLAARSINSKANGRGKISEIVIMNYNPDERMSYDFTTNGNGNGKLV